MTSTKASAAIELLVTLDRGGDGSLHQQLEQQLRVGIRDGRLASGTTMPSSRALAAQLGVARGVVVEAYEQLIAEGYLISRQGGSTRVADLPAPAPRRSPTTTPEAETIDLRPGRPDVTEFPRAAWARAARRVLSSAPSDRFTYLDGLGTPELSAVLADYVGRARGAATHADDIVIATGFMQAMHIVARALAELGLRRIAVEEPYDPSYRATLGVSGADVVPIPVDEGGISAEAVEASGADAVVVTPAHQFPTGAVLAPERRTALLAWARDGGHLIIEDDYDAEYRYDRDPVGAMQGLDPEHVVYAGTASKSLAPGIRLAWLAVPTRLHPLLTAAKSDLDHGSSAIEQLLLADAIEHGELDRHLRRMRTIYRRRRDAMLAALASQLPTWRPVGASAGLHLLVELPDEVDEARLITAAARSGVLVYGLGRYRAALGPRWPGVGLCRGRRRTDRPGRGAFGHGCSDRRTVDDRRLVHVSLSSLVLESRPAWRHHRSINPRTCKERPMTSTDRTRQQRSPSQRIRQALSRTRRRGQLGGPADGVRHDRYRAADERFNLPRFY